MKYKNQIKKSKNASFYLLMAIGSIVGGIALGVAMIYMNGAKITFQDGFEIVKQESNAPQGMETLQPKETVVPQTTAEPASQETLVPTTAPTEAATVAPSSVPSTDPTKKPAQSNGSTVALYLDSTTITDSKALEKQVKLVKDTSKLNTLVFDVKDETGYVAFDIGIAGVKEIGALKKGAKKVNAVLESAKKQGIYTVARVVVFRDPILAKSNSELVIKDKSGKIIKDSKSESWVNPYNKEVWEYELAIIEAFIKAGFDEVQLDYVRFNTDSKFQDAVYTKEKKTKTELITEFTKEASKRVHALGGKVSMNVYGTVFANSSDAARLGQDVTELSALLDYICPTLYPASYANGAFGIAYPDLQPYEIVSSASKKVLEAVANTKGENVAQLRPWIQGYTASNLTKHQTYGKKQVEEQIKALQENGIKEYAVWGNGDIYKKIWK